MKSFLLTVEVRVMGDVLKKCKKTLLVIQQQQQQRGKITTCTQISIQQLIILSTQYVKFFMCGIKSEHAVPSSPFSG